MSLTIECLYGALQKVTENQATRRAPIGTGDDVAKKVIEQICGPRTDDALRRKLRGLRNLCKETLRINQSDPPFPKNPKTVMGEILEVMMVYFYYLYKGKADFRSNIPEGARGKLCATGSACIDVLMSSCAVGSVPQEFQTNEGSFPRNDNLRSFVHGMMMRKDEGVDIAMIFNCSEANRCVVFIQCKVRRTNSPMKTDSFKAKVCDWVNKARTELLTEKEKEETNFEAWVCSYLSRPRSFTDNDPYLEWNLHFRYLQPYLSHSNAEYVKEYLSRLILRERDPAELTRHFRGLHLRPDGEGHS